MASKVCDSCSSSGKAPASVPYAAFESSMSRAERIIKRLVIALIVTIALTFASNIGWLIYANNNGNSSTNGSSRGLTPLFSVNLCRCRSWLCLKGRRTC